MNDNKTDLCLWSNISVCSGDQALIYFYFYFFSRGHVMTGKNDYVNGDAKEQCNATL